MLKSKDQEYCDLTKELYDKVKAVQDKGNEKTVAEHIRATYLDPQKGLLLIYPIDHMDSGETKYFKIGEVCAIVTEKICILCKT